MSIVNPHHESPNLFDWKLGTFSEDPNALGSVIQKSLDASHAVHRPPSLKRRVIKIKARDPAMFAISCLAEGKLTLNRALFWAAMKGLATHVEQLLDAGADGRAVDHWGNTPLNKAITFRHPDVVRVLLKFLDRIDLSKKDTCGQEPLHLAAMLGEAEIADQLLTAGAEVDKTNSQGSAPLHLAVERGHNNVVKALVAHRAKLNEKNAERNTPWHLAILGLDESSEFHKIAEQLLVAKADLEVEDKWCRTPLLLLAQTTQVEFAARLIGNGAKWDVIAVNSTTPLHAAASSSDCREMVELLIGSGVNLNARDGQGYTALNLAAKSGHLNVVIGLVARGAAPEISDLSGNTLLHWAAERGHGVIVKRLTSSPGVNLNARTGQGFTALHLAAKSGHLNVVMGLVARGAALEISDLSGCTPLHWAATKRHGVIVSFLLSCGGDVHRKNLMGYTPIDLLEVTGQARVDRATNTIYWTEH